jgi:type III secretory pathway component EscU
MNVNLMKGRLWLCVPIIITDLLDATVTMIGQSADYWKGSYDRIDEFNPIARWLLTIHPIGIVIYTILDIAVISLLIMLMPLMISKTLSAFWAIGSAKAIYNWLVGPLHMGWWISNLVILVPTIILVYAFDKASTNQLSTDTRQVMSADNFLKKRG